MLSKPRSNRLCSTGAKLFMISSTPMKPAVSVIGKPTANRFSCGAARVSTPSAMLATSRMATIGSDSSRPAANTVSPVRAMKPQPPALTGAVVTGSHSKLRTRMSIISRWPFTARKSRVASRFRKSDSTAVCPPASGSKKIANDRPICMPISAPAMSTAAKTMRIMKPMAMPMNICCAKIASPRPPPGATCGIGGITGSTAIATPMPIASRTRTDTPRLENTGADENSPSRRASGNISAASQASSWAAVTSIMSGWADASSLRGTGERGAPEKVLRGR